MSKVLVTGATGVIGSHVVTQLAELGHTVVGVDLRPQPQNMYGAGADAEIIAGDIGDFSGMLGIIKRHGIERIVHLAAFLSAESLGNPMESVRINALGTGNVLDAAWNHDVEKVCMASTISVYGPPRLYGDRPVTEDDAPSPTTPYGVSKLASEIAGRLYREDRGLDVTCIRPSVCYGIGRFSSLSGHFIAFIRDVALGIPTAFPSWPGGPEKGKLQTIYAKDMAATFVAGVLSPRTEDWIFNAPTTEVYSIPEVVELMKELVPDAQIRIAAETTGVVDEFPLVDGSRAREQLGVVPRYSLREGIAEMIAHFREEASA